MFVIWCFNTVSLLLNVDPFDFNSSRILSVFGFFVHRGSSGRSCCCWSVSSTLEIERLPACTHTVTRLTVGISQLTLPNGYLWVSLQIWAISVCDWDVELMKESGSEGSRSTTSADLAGSCDGLGSWKTINKVQIWFDWRRFDITWGCVISVNTLEVLLRGYYNTSDVHIFSFPSKWSALDHLNLFTTCLIIWLLLFSQVTRK